MCGEGGGKLSSAHERELAEYRAEDDVRTLQQAREIQADRSRLSAARKVARKKLSSLRSISGRR